MEQGFITKIKQLMKNPEMASLVFLIILSIVIGIMNPVFFTATNLINILRQISIRTILAVSMSFIIISGGIDLSVGKIVGLTAVVGSYVGSIMGLPDWMALISMFVAGALFGLCNGLMVTQIGLPPFIASLGMTSVSYGVALMIAGGTPIRYANQDSWILILGSAKIANIPLSVVAMLVIVIAGYLVSRYTVYGRNIYIIGNSEKAAKLSGIKVEFIKTIPYVFSGLLAAVAGLIYLGQLSAGDASYGDGLELDAIAASVIGGISMTGGSGNIFGVIVGAAIMGVIRNAFVLLRIPSYWQIVCVGIVIIASVSFDSFRKKKA